MIRFLYIAYAATWIIHLTYLAILGRGYKRVKEELHELGQNHDRSQS
jgi:CcmD family protein